MRSLQLGIRECTTPLAAVKESGKLKGKKQAPVLPLTALILLRRRVAACLRRSAGMQLSCSLKSRCLVTLLVAPYGKDDPDPDVSQSTHSDAMAFAFLALALVVLRRSGFCFVLC